MDIIIEQDGNAALLQQAINNYKKSPTDRKTVDYITKKRDEINKLWDIFEKCDRRIRSNTSIKEDHPYYKGCLYEQIGKKYNDIIERLQQDYKDAQENPSTSASVPDKGNATNTANIGSTKTKIITAFSVLYQKQQKGIAIVKTMLNQLLADNELRTAQFYKIKLMTVEQHWKHVQQLHEKLWSSDDEYDFDHFIQEEENINEAFLALHERMEGLTSSTASPNLASNISQATTTKVALPKISLPTFNGEYANWRQFRDLFVEMVHNQQLASCQKMWYLRSSIVGEAARLIQHFTTSDENYETAWQILNKRYENKRLAVGAILNKLLSQQQIIKDSANSVKSMHDITQECLMSLKSIEIKIDNWDPLLLHILTQLLDRPTQLLWEQTITNPREIPSIADFLKFLELRFQSLEALGPTKRSGSQSSSALLSTKIHCAACKGDHGLYHCAQFLSMTAKQRLHLAQQARVCVNCLRNDHKANTCSSKRSCNKCAKKHNTLLHLDACTKENNQHLTKRAETKERTSSNTKISVEPPNTSASSTSSNCSQSASLAATPTRNGISVLLSTVLINVEDINGKQVKCRAVLDTGSQINFVTTSLVKKLGVERSKNVMNIQGIGSIRNKATERVNLHLFSRTSGFSSRMEAQVLPQIVSKQPNRYIDIRDWNLPKNLQLADPTFNIPSDIEMLIGAGLFYCVLSIGQIKIGDSLPILQNSLLGWIIGGEYASPPSPTVTCGISTDEELNEAVGKFWEIEECDTRTKNFTTAEIRCEKNFSEHTRRATDGRFVVRLPFRHDPRELGNSYDVAIQRFKGMERRLQRDPELKQQYIKFMQEYQYLGHMEEVQLPNMTKPHYILPHHSVIKADSTTTKVRVVFDASAKTSSNVALNDILAIGPTIQDDVFTELLRFRFPRYVFTADVEKMYRQVWVHRDDRKFQLILWRSDPSQQIKCYQLKTVTYGTSAAPYLAIRCLKQLAEECKQRFPLASEALEQNFYVDDVLSGADDIKTAIDKQKQLREVLSSAGFHLRKWCSNDQRLLRQIPPEDQEINLEISHSNTDNVKTMGLIWHPKNDWFTIKSSSEFSKRVTKRSALAEISRFFDPLGFIAPVTITAKIFLQSLWKLKLDWDAALPQELNSRWIQFRSELENINRINVSRHVFGQHETHKKEFHIFADASEKAYGAVAYVRSISSEGLIIVRLLCAKSKVAPTKQITIPRLELCAAKLAVELMQRIQKDLDYDSKHFHLWTDSADVLGWIRAESSNYHTFVANRVSSIQRISTATQWHHVSSEENPADMLSRGLYPSQLVNNNHWFYGPKLLHSPVDTWGNQKHHFEECTLERRKNMTVSMATCISNDDDDLFKRIKHGNSFRRLQRVIAYIMRITKPINPGGRLLGKANRVVRADEMQDALIRIVKYTQQQDFGDQIQFLRKHKTVEHNNPLASLTPFLDDRDILRVGGRLESSNISFDAKHPMLISNRHPFSKLLLTTLHNENLHAGVQTLLSISRQQFWIINGKTLARNIVHNCIQCTRAKPKLLQQMMGNLPRDRITPNRPFVITGVDFFGPIFVHFKCRGKRPQKAYVSVFCCFSTKAIHMELVSDLTTEAFIGALKRFMGRRGHCQKIYCDNATNFVGARNCLNEIRDSIHSEESSSKILSMCSSNSVEFCFIPPRAPHFGGLWEAAVKSAKALLQKILTSVSLTYEEMETVIIEAESILNSRPLTTMSSDPNDMTALTPGHFLIGESIRSTIDSEATPENINLATRWKLVTQLKSEFWRRWSSEYLQQLQHRYQWKQRREHIKPGMMVIIKEDNLPSLRWPLGRIVKTISGEDGLVRVADVRTATSTLRRPIHRLAPLPANDEQGLADEPVDKEVRSSRKRKSQSCLATLLLTCLVLPFVSSATVQTERFKNDPGIYYERMGIARIISSDWNLVNYLELQPLWQEYELTHSYIKTLANLCTTGLSCQKTMNQFQRQFKTIEANNNLLRAGSHQPREKRGAFNFIGNVANGLFGILDSEYAEKLSSTIKDINHNEDTLNTMIQNQTVFIDRTVTIMKRNRAEIELEFKAIEKFLHKSNLAVANLSEQMRLQQLSSIFDELALQALIHISNYQRIQEAIIAIMTDAHHGKINPELLTPSELRKELDTIEKNNAKTIKLPISTRAIAKYYRIMSISHTMTKSYIIFNIKIPLTTVNQYELLSLTAIPWYANQTFYNFKLSAPYLIVDFLRENYYPLSKEDLQQCICIDNVQFLCHQVQPLFHQNGQLSSCEMTLLTHSRHLENCNTAEDVGVGPHWLSLREPNSWIYAVASATQLNVVCEDKPSQLVINGVGMLKVGDQCIIKTSDITIEGHTSFTKTRQIAYMPTLNISTRIGQLTSQPELDNYTMKYQSQSDQLLALQNQIRELKAVSLSKLRPHDIHHYGLGYMLLITVTCISAYTIWYLRCKRQPHNAEIPTEVTQHGPSAAPRTQQTAFDAESTIITVYDS